jgi:hypothetical protein
MTARTWPALEPAVFAAMFAAYTAATPLGLGPLATAAATAQGVLLRHDGAGSPLGLLGAHVLTWLPVADLATRLALASAVAGALAVMFLGRAACQILLLHPEHRASRSLVIPCAAGGAATVVGMTLGPFSAATSAGVAATAMAVVAGGVIWAVRLLVAPEDRNAGLGLSLLAGLAAGVHPAAVALLWPLAGSLWLRSLSNGQGWARFAPLLWAGGLGLALGSTVATHQSGTAPWSSMAALFPHLTTSPTGIVALIEIGEQTGVVALLLSVFGLTVLAPRVPSAFLLIVGMLGVGTWLGGAATGAAAGLLALPIAAGVASLASRFTPGQVVSAVALVIIAAIGPALDGGQARWRVDPRLPARVLELAIDRVPVRGVVDPGTPAMRGLFRYAAAVGLRPDLVVVGERQAR